MNKYNLPEGFYKIQKAVYQPYGAKHLRTNSNTIKLLRVAGQGNNKRYFINEDASGRRPEDIPDFHNYEIISQYAGQPTIKECRTYIEFIDGSGTTFRFQVNSLSAIKRLSSILIGLRNFI
ncbi:MAG: hypothetical protein MUF43_10705 [Flavobacterium sp.]|jgi:hypothetical protein|nr:hypothetical protein [Flavobacterium sp.]